MKKRHVFRLVALVALLLMAIPTIALADLTVTQSIPVSLTLTGDTPPSKASFTFVLAADNSKTPMPSQTTLSIQGEGTGSFGPISYNEPNDYTYKLYQVSGNLTGYTYDTTVYAVTVRVTSDSAGNLTSTVWMTGKTGDSKPSIASFSNKYRVRTDIPKTGYDDEAREFVDEMLTRLADAL